MMVLSLGMFLIQDSELRMHGGIQGKALSSGCCFQGILAFQLFQQRKREEAKAQLTNIRKTEGQIDLTEQLKLQTRFVLPEKSQGSGLNMNLYDKNLLK